MASRYGSFAEFWPFYLGEHSKPLTRWLHFVGTSLVVLNAIWAIATLHPLWLLLCPVYGYFWAWVGHFVVEKNRPATFTYPLWSLIGDFKMWAMMATGRLGAELARLQIVAKA